MWKLSPHKVAEPPLQTSNDDNLSAHKNHAYRRIAIDPSSLP